MELENVNTPDETKPLSQPGTEIIKSAPAPVVDAVDQAKQQGMELVHQAQDKAGDVVDQVQGQLKSRLTDEKNVASTYLGHVAEAVQEAGKSLRDKDQAGLGDYADGAAKLVTNFSEYLKKTEIENFAGDLQTFARQRPALFVGSLFVVGLVAGRFLKSSNHHAATTA